MQNLLRAVDAIRHEGKLAAPMGSSRVALVDTRDVGAAAAVVLADPARHASQTYRLTGPAAVSYDEVADALSVVASRGVVYEPVPPDEYEAQLVGRGVPAWRAFDLGHIASAYGSSDHVVSEDLQRLLGRPPRSLSQFLEDHREEFS